MTKRTFVTDEELIDQLVELRVDQWIAKRIAAGISTEEKYAEKAKAYILKKVKSPPPAPAADSAE